MVCSLLFVLCDAWCVGDCHMGYGCGRRAVRRCRAWPGILTARTLSGMTFVFLLCGDTGIL
jgi:hypothetical protein